MTITNMKLIINIVALILVSSSIFTQNIKTIKLHPKGDNLSYPILALNSTKKIVLSFDDLSEDMRQFTYQIKLYDSNWDESDVDESEYIDGFTYGDVIKYGFSQATAQSYVHYKLEIPNEDTKIISSGNYEISILLDDEIIFSKKFYVYEQKVGISGKVKTGDLNNKNQMLWFDVNFKNYPQDFEESQVKVCINQNNRPDRTYYNINHSNYFDKNFEFHSGINNVFYSGSEYENINTKDYNILPRNVNQVLNENKFYNFKLIPYNYRLKTTYANRNDINGNFLIDAVNVNNIEEQADYVKVEFSVLPNLLNTNLDYYVIGAFNDYSNNSKSKLKYNKHDNLYKKTLILKQGFYDYKFKAIDKDTEKEEPQYVENNYFQTSNDYLIFVYFRSFDSEIDKLIGFQKIQN
jgi:hypothetical protein